jgi:hypothetical protein
VSDLSGCGLVAGSRVPVVYIDSSAAAASAAARATPGSTVVYVSDMIARDERPNCSWNDLDIDADGQRKCRGEMAQVMQPDRRQAAAVGDQLEHAGATGRVRRKPRNASR